MINAFSVDGHEPQRTSWVCQRCDAPFPCEPARQVFRACLGAIPLAMFVWAAFNAAVLDLGDNAPPVGDLFDRFIRWTRRTLQVNDRRLILTSGAATASRSLSYISRKRPSDGGPRNNPSEAGRSGPRRSVERRRRTVE